jgi:HK97 family phage portal protein
MLLLLLPKKVVMGIFDNIFSPPQIDSRSFKGPREAFGGLYSGLFGIPAINSEGTMANHRTAFTISAFYNGVDQISNDIAKLPKHIYKKQDNKRFITTDHPANYLIASAPNELMTSFDFWKIITVSTIIKGNGFAEIIRNQYSAKEEAFIFLNHDDVKVYKTETTMYYMYKGRRIDSANMLHFKGFSFDGIVGVGIITFAAAQLGTVLDAKSYQSDIYKDRGIGYGVIESDIPVDKAVKKVIEDGFTAKMSQKSKFKVPMLDEGMKYKSISITPAEAQFLETDKNAVIEVCRWLNIAPHKLKHLDNATFTNIQHQSIEHVQDSLMPWMIRFEQELNRKLFFKNSKEGFYAKFNEKVLLRGDLEAKRNYYTSLIYSGAATRNEVRAWEDMDPIEGLDEPLQPVNMQALSIANQLIEEQKQQSNNQ